MVKHLITALLAALASVNLFAQKEGETLFRNNCAACHTIGKGRLVGPDLKDIHTKRSEEWLLKWTKSSSSLIKEGDTAAVAIFNEYKVPMTDFIFLSDDTIKNILAYIKTESGGTVIAPALVQQQETPPANAIPATKSFFPALSFADYLLLSLCLVLLVVVFVLARTIKKLSDELKKEYVKKQEHNS